eukprot:scaffold39474_cov33-Tisochrysis_lutea.AAC.1
MERAPTPSSLLSGRRSTGDVPMDTPSSPKRPHPDDPPNQVRASHLQHFQPPCEGCSLFGLDYEKYIGGPPTPLRRWHRTSRDLVWEPWMEAAVPQCAVWCLVPLSQPESHLRQVHLREIEGRRKTFEKDGAAFFTIR